MSSEALPSLTTTFAKNYARDPEAQRSQVRVLLLTDSFVPTTTSTAKLVKDLADELTRRSIAVTVLVPTAVDGASYDVSIEDSIEVIRVRTSKTKGATKILRGLREIRFSQQIWLRARTILSQRNFDLIIFFSPTIFFGRLVERLKTLFGCPAYLVLRDLWTQFMLDVGELQPGLVREYLSRFEQKQYAIADVIGVQSPGDLRYFDSGRGSHGQPVELLFNWYSEDSRADRPTGYRERLGLVDRVVFFFGGNFGVAQDPLNVLRLASTLRGEPCIHLLLVGWGSYLPAMRRMISERGLTNVTLLDTVPQDEFTAILREADVGVISLDRRFKINNLPGRLLAYFSAGLPVLASVNPSSDLFAILNENGVGYCCRNGDDESLREYALALARDASLRTTLGHRGRALLGTTFSAKRAANQILAHFVWGKFAQPESRAIRESASR